MLKLRLKRNGRKKQPSYRLVVMPVNSRRNGRSIDQVGYYDTMTKKYYLNIIKITKWLEKGVKPTQTVYNLLKKANVIED
jgi:small subunit ribosomal protein S16